MLGSAILTAENDRSNSQAHEVATPNAPATNSKNHRVSMRILKALLLLLYILLTVYLFLWALLFAIHLRNSMKRIDESQLALIRSLLPSVTGLLTWSYVPAVVWCGMTRYHSGV